MRRDRPVHAEVDRLPGGKRGAAMGAADLLDVNYGVVEGHVLKVLEVLEVLKVLKVLKGGLPFSSRTSSTSSTSGTFAVTTLRTRHPR